ncbi:hypothetical protein ACFONG_15590 [Uliginosibacterium paludis]|uniref:hypothetical protein n=1 Tax=Uliginosibacterium paludis TaxID=1615952 RepID=UPI0031F6318D
MSYGFLFNGGSFTSSGSITNTVYCAPHWPQRSLSSPVGKMIIRNANIGSHSVSAAPHVPASGTARLARTFSCLRASCQRHCKSVGAGNVKRKSEMNVFCATLVRDLFKGISGATKIPLLL